MLLECSSVITQRSTIVWMAAMTLEEEASSLSGCMVSEDVR